MYKYTLTQMFETVFMNFLLNQDNKSLKATWSINITFRYILMCNYKCIIFHPKVYSKNNHKNAATVEKYEVKLPN